jgi:hypothetical protein
LSWHNWSTWHASLVLSEVWEEVNDNLVAFDLVPGHDGDHDVVEGKQDSDDSGWDSGSVIHRK